MKLTGRAVECSWTAISFEPLLRIHDLRHRFRIRPLGGDESGQFLQFATSIGDFWIQRVGRDMSPMLVLRFLLSEHAALNTLLGRRSVQPGDVVIDVGAHIGAFARDALRRGAARVVLVEPDPLNQECLRRNFSRELAAGTAVLIPKGAWSVPRRLRFERGLSNSGTGSFVLHDPAATHLDLEVDRLDTLLVEAGITRVDFIKFDIEGAEREALRGAAGTLRRDAPRILLDAYHLPDDPAVFRSVIAAANPAYRATCLACESRRTDSGMRVGPHAYVFEAPAARAPHPPGPR
jgi:FkbM family methyltransferase